jgi:hypothetical protein
MTLKRKEIPWFAVCINNADYPVSLELHKIYHILPDNDAAQNGDIRVVDESGEDYVYHAAWFAVVDLPQVIQDSILHAA